MIHIMDAHCANLAGIDAHTSHSSRWLWAVFAAMLLSWIITWFWTSLSRLNRILRVVPFIALGVATHTYYWMASDKGWVFVLSESEPHATRLVWYIRDIQQMINMPLVLLVLLSLTSLDTIDVFGVLFFSWAWVVSGSVAAYTPPLIKASQVAYAQLFMVHVGIRLLGVIRGAKFAHPDFKTAFSVGAMYLSLTSASYPTCAQLSESDTASATVCYSILDILSTPVFLIGFLVYVSFFSDQQLRMTAGNAGQGNILVTNKKAKKESQSGPQPKVGPRVKQ